jgi:hypothetical protein
MPRRSAAALAVVTPLTDARPLPPEDLPEAQAAHWRRIVGRMPHDWFPPETQPLLVALCRHIVLAHELAAMVSEFRREWYTADGGLERLDRLAKMQDREHRAMASLATRLRLTPQARYTPHRAAGAAAKPRGSVPWGYAK